MNMQNFPLNVCVTANLHSPGPHSSTTSIMGIEPLHSGGLPRQWRGVSLDSHRVPQGWRWGEPRNGEFQVTVCRAMPRPVSSNQEKHEQDEAVSASREPGPQAFNWNVVQQDKAARQRRKGGRRTGRRFVDELILTVGNRVESPRETITQDLTKQIDLLEEPHFKPRNPEGETEAFYFHCYIFKNWEKGKT